jgi:hypothetical protein
MTTISLDRAIQFVLLGVAVVVLLFRAILPLFLEKPK